MAEVGTTEPAATAPSRGPAAASKRFSICAKLLVIVWLATLPLLNPWVRGDGVGYYAYIQAPLIQGNLDFRSAWLHGNPSFLLNRIDAQGRLKPDQFTANGHVANHFSVGPAILWAPFLVPVHLIVLGLDRLGWRIAADGYSSPYLEAMALGTACYGFLALWMGFLLGREYGGERAALAGTLGIWFGSSLLVYMYFNPSWAHAQAAFSVALFLWYWHRTRRARNWRQWIWLGLAGGLMLDVYYPNFALFVLPLADAARDWRGWLRQTERWAEAGWRFATGQALFAAAVVAGFLPTLVTRWIVDGSPFRTGYGELWYPWAPFRWKVLFSSEHGLFSWTPILALAVLGLVVMWKRERLGGLLLLVFAVFYYTISCYQYWHGLASFGNRFFISLTPIFVVGLTALLEAVHRRSGGGRLAWRASCAAVALLVAWNLGFVFQWGTQMVPARGPISWRQMSYNQVVGVPQRAGAALGRYFTHRSGMMRNLEQQDLQRVEKKGRKSGGPSPAQPR